MVAALAIFNFFFGEPTLPEGTHESANAPAKAGEPTEKTERITLATARTPSDFTHAVATASTDELEEHLQHLGLPISTSLSFPAQIERHRQRVQVAEQLLMHRLRPHQHELALSAKLQGLSAIYNVALDSGYQLALNEDREQLLEFAKSLVDDRSEQVRKNARLTIFGLTALDGAKSPDAMSQVETIASLAVESVEQNKDDQAVLNYVRTIVLRINRSNLEVGKAVMKAIISHKSELTSETGLALLRDLTDSVLLAEAELKTKLERLEAGAGSDKQEVIDSIVALAANPEGSETVLDELTMAGHRLEALTEMESAQTLYQTILDSVDQRSTDSARDFARRIGNDGLTRVHAINRPLHFQETRFNGESFSSESIAGRKAVIVFISFSKMDAVDTLRDLYGELQGLSRQDVKVLVLNIDESTPEEVAEVGTEFPGIIFLKRGDEQADSRTLYQQYPAHVFPQAILVNREGHIVQTAIKLNEITSKIR